MNALVNFTLAKLLVGEITVIRDIKHMNQKKFGRRLQLVQSNRLQTYQFAESVAATSQSQRRQH